MTKVELFQGDCLELLKQVPDRSVDLILCDLPYGTTQNRWDQVLPLAALWREYDRVSRGAVVLTASQPFTSHLVLSRPELFKYTWTWDKVNRATGHLNSKRQPLRITEDVVVFYGKQPTYNPQMVQGKPYRAISRGSKSGNYGTQKDGVVTVNEGSYYPRNLIAIPADERGTEGRVHPTQKPIALMEYLVKTYTNPGDTVLDNCMGSGTTGVAAVRNGRSFIGMELDEGYFKLAQGRIATAGLDSAAF